LVLATLCAVGIVAWTVAIFVISPLRFVVFTPRAKTGFDVSVALLSLFVALVLLLFPSERERTRLDWVAVGFLILGTGALLFGYLLPVLRWSDHLGRAMYCSLVVRSTALLAMGVGLVAPRPPHLTGRTAVGVTAGTALVVASTALISSRLPRLVRADDLQAIAARSTTTLFGLTAWHWALSAIPLVLALAAVAGSVRHADELGDRGSFVVGLTLMAGSQLHTMFWPSAYSPILTTASILRLAFTVILSIGAVLALRRIALERTAVLAMEREVATRLAELSTLRADFVAMVGHELASPVATLRGYAAMLTTGALDGSQQALVGTALEAEVQLLATLVDDVRAAAAAERAEFDLHPTPVPLGPLLADAAAFARSLPGDHPLEESSSFEAQVLADADRITQVLRNLLGNAGKHTPAGVPITLRAEHRGDRVRIEVADWGPGINPSDRERIFEKFGRGEHTTGGRVPGVGLGLYLSRRIVRAHGGELGVEETPGGGATFWFTLPVAR
jgi:signal transduction histidine kinase